MVAFICTLDKKILILLHGIFSLISFVHFYVVEKVRELILKVTQWLHRCRGDDKVGQSDCLACGSWGFKSQPRQPKSLKQVVTAPLINASVSATCPRNDHKRMSRVILGVAL